MNTPVGLLVRYCGSLVHGYARVLANLENGQLRLVMVGSQDVLDCNRYSIREATNPVAISICKTIADISEEIEDIEWEENFQSKLDAKARRDDAAEFKRQLAL